MEQHHFYLLPVLLLCLFAFAACQTDDGSDMQDTTVAQTQDITEAVDTTDAVTETPIVTETKDIMETVITPPTSVLLADAPRTVITPTACEQIPLDADTISKTMQETICADQATALVCTVDDQYHLALCTDDGYISIALLSENPLFSWQQVTLAPFSDVFGYAGVVVTVPVSANTMERRYIALDGEKPILLAITAKGTSAQNGMLIEQYSMGGILNLYRMEDGDVVCYDLHTLFHSAYAYADQIWVSYFGNLFYESHNGLFTIQVQNPGEIGYGDNYAGWFDGDSIMLIHWDDMVLPEAADTEDIFRTDDAARTWITNTMNTDFVLREPIDPTTLNPEELQNYMDDAYRAGYSVLMLYEIASDMMFGGVVMSGNDPAFFCAGEWYYDMKNPAFPTFAAWENYMHSILSEEITDTLTARTDRFISLNGELWGVMGARGSNIRMSEAGTAVTSVSDTEIVFTVSVNIADPQIDLGETETMTHDFVYSKTEDGWRWTKLYVYN